MALVTSSLFINAAMLAVGVHHFLMMEHYIFLTIIVPFVGIVQHGLTSKGLKLAH